MNAFEIVSEFRFEVGNAILNSQKLTGAVDNLSTAADGALLSFQRVGAGIVATMGLGSGGAAGLLYAAVKSADKFRQTQLALVNIMGNNTMNMETGTKITDFNEKLAVAEQIMGKVNRLAGEFALPADDLMAFTKQIAPILQSEGQGGVNMGNAIDISRSLLKSAPTLGIDPSLISGQLMRLVSGHADMGDTLFNRLVSDTSSFGQFKQSGSKGFNQMDAGKRVGLLREALRQFSSDTSVLTGNVKTLKGQMQLLSDAVVGTFSIFRPIGRAILDSFIPVLEYANRMLRTQGVEIGTMMGRFLKSVIEDPKKLLVGLLQAKDLKADFSMGKHMLETWLLLDGIYHAIKWLNPELAFGGKLITLIRYAFSGMNVVFGYLMSALTWITGASSGFGALYVIFNYVFYAVTAVAARLFVLLGILQLISRSIAYARVSDAQDMIEASGAFAESIAQLKTGFDILTEPFSQFFDRVAQSGAWIFKFSYYLDILTSAFNGLGNGMIELMATVQGMLAGIMQMVANVGELKIFGGSLGFGDVFQGVGDAFDAAMEDVFKKAFDRMGENTKALATQNVNISKIEIRNDFKEQQEPDRVAFSMKEQIWKAAQNPLQSRQRSFSGGMVGA